MTIAYAACWIDFIDGEYQAGRSPLVLMAGERRVLRDGSRVERRRLLAAKHFAWCRWAGA